MKDGGCSLTFVKVINPNIILDHHVVLTHRISVTILLIKIQKRVPDQGS